jgi:hypothetical protein
VEVLGRRTVLRGATILPLMLVPTPPAVVRAHPEMNANSSPAATHVPLPRWMCLYGAPRCTAESSRGSSRWSHQVALLDWSATPLTHVVR